MSLLTGFFFCSLFVKLLRNNCHIRVNYLKSCENFFTTENAMKMILGCGKGPRHVVSETDVALFSLE